MRVRHHEYERVAVLDASGRVLFEAHDAMVHCRVESYGRFVDVSPRDGAHGFIPKFLGSGWQVEDMAPWWLRVSLRTAVKDGKGELMVDATLYALVADGGVVPVGWPDAMRGQGR